MCTPSLFRCNSNWQLECSYHWDHLEGANDEERKCPRKVKVKARTFPDHQLREAVTCSQMKMSSTWRFTHITGDSFSNITICCGKNISHPFLNERTTHIFWDHGYCVLFHGKSEKEIRDQLKLYKRVWIERESKRGGSPDDQRVRRFLIGKDWTSRLINSLILFHRGLFERYFTQGRDQRYCA